MDANFQFRQFIFELSKSLTTKDAKGLNLLMNLPYAELNSPVDTMTYLVQKKNLSPGNMSDFVVSLRAIDREDLVQEIDSYVKAINDTIPSENENNIQEVINNTNPVENENDNPDLHKSNSEEYTPSTTEDSMIDETDYCMESKGLCLIFSNSFPNKFLDFSGNSNAMTNSYDVEKLFQTFGWLNFTIKLFDNLSRNEMLETIRDHMLNQNNHNISCLAIFILSCGKNGIICSADGEPINIKEDVINLISPHECKCLLGKPKLFFIQLSQPPASLEESCKTKCKCVSAESDPSNINVTTDRDIFVYSSKIGSSASTEVKKGSFFIQKLCQVLQRKAHSRYFYEILLKVNKYIDKTIEQHQIEPLEGLFDMNTLQKKILFKPLTVNFEGDNSTQIMQDSSTT